MEDSIQPVPGSDIKIIFLTDSLTDLKEIGNWTLKRQNALFEKLIKTPNKDNIIKCYKKIIKTVNTLNKSLSDITIALDIEFKKWALQNGFDKKTCEILCSSISKAHEKTDEVCEQSQKNNTDKENDSIILNNKDKKIVESIVKVNRETVNKYLESVANKSDHKNKPIENLDANTEFENIEVKNTKTRTSEQQENITLNSEKIKKLSDLKESSNTVLDTSQITENVFESEKDMNDQRDEERNNMENCEKHESGNMADGDALKDQSEVNKNCDEKIQEENAKKKGVKKINKPNKSRVVGEVESENRNKEIVEEEDKNKSNECNKATENCKDGKSKDECIVTENPKNISRKEKNKVDGSETIENVDLQIEDVENECVESSINKDDKNDSEICNENDNTELTESKEKKSENELLKDKSGTENKNKNPEIDKNEDGKGKSKEIIETVGKNRRDKMKNKKTNDTDVEPNIEKKKSKDKREEMDEDKVEFEKEGNKSQAEKESQNCEIDKNENDESSKKDTAENKKQKDKKKSVKTNDKNDMKTNVELNKEKENTKDKSEDIVEKEVELKKEGRKELETSKIRKDKSRQLQGENESQNNEIDQNEDEETKKKEIVEKKKQKNKKTSKKAIERINTESIVEPNDEEIEKSKDKSEVTFEEEVEKQDKESETTKTKDAELVKEKTKIDELDEEGEKSDQDDSVILIQNSNRIVIDSTDENDASLIDDSDKEEEKIKSEIKKKNTDVKTEMDTKVDNKIGIIKLVDISKLVDKVGFVLSPPRIQEPECIPEKSKKRKSVSFMIDSDSSDKANKSKNKETQIENITISSDESDFESKSKLRQSTTRRHRNSAKVMASKFNQLRVLRERKFKKRRISVESDSSDSDASNKLTKEVNKNSRQKKQLKSIDTSDPKFYLPCSVVIEKSDLSKPEMYLKRYLDLKETKSIERLSDLSSLKKRKRNAKKASSDVSDNVSSDSDKQGSKRTRQPQKKKSKGKSESDEEMPLRNLKKKIDGDSDDVSDDDAPLTNLKNQTDVPKSDFSEPESVGSPSDSENSSQENNKKKKDSSKKKSTDKENKSDSDAEKNNGTDKNDKKKENVDSEDSDFQKKKSWKKDKLLHGKLTESGSSDEEEQKKSKSQKKKKRGRRVLGSDSEAHSDDGSDEEFEIKKNKKKNNSDKSSEDSDDDATKKKKHRRIKEIKDSDDSSENEDEDGESGKRRKKIRAVLKDDLLSKTTRDAAKEEQERKKRISDRQKMYNEMYDLALENKAKVDKVVLDFDPETKKELIKVHPDLVEKLKPHQANGVKFMWDACFESLEQTKKDKGSGCILAHCMGLGKTLQVVTLIHTLLTHKKTGVRTVMVVCPLSTVLNWVNEFKIWLDSINDGEDVNVFEISRYKKNYERAYQIKEWQECGGVLILGYEMFRLLSNDANKRIRKKNRDSLQSGLVDPGPDLVVCDEGHLLKNEKSRLSKAMNCLKTMRRIVLTGTPVQNNLKEYYCMVQFVKPNLLGKYNEYTNRFVNPITNGQYTDSTPRDIAIMKRRSHVLHKLLDGVVQRRDYAVLAPFLPPKHEYVCFLTLTDIQKKLYTIYMDHQSKRGESGGKAVALFADFQALQRIWTHPRMLKAYSEKYEKDQEKKAILSDEEGSLVDFIDDDDETSSSESEAVSTSDEKSNDSMRFKSKRKSPPKRRTRASAAQKADEGGSDSDEVLEVKPPNPTEWWCDYIKEDELDNLKYSAKLLLLFDILKKCEQIGDKVLVFSQSLYSLDLIEYFLEKIDEATQNGESNESLAGHSASWALGLDYFRLDGSSSVENRAAWCKSFNDEDNPRARLFLISTKAGGLGINLVAANRVIIFDVSWNPSHDVQSIFRIYRFGQKKPCYVYRFIAMGTMEEKVYERQVTKQAISKRVIDEQQIDRHYNQNDLAELYKFTPEPEGERPVPMLPKDRMFAELLQEHENLIYRYHEHDSLLENKEEEELDEDERRAAWDEFENEKTAKPATGLMGSMIRPSMTPEQAAYALEVMLRNEHPAWNDIQIRQMVPAILQQMYQQAIAGDWTLYNRVMSYQVTLQQQIMAAQTRLMNPALQTVIAANQKAKESQWAAMVKRMQMGSANRPSTSKETRPTPAPRPRPFDPNEVVNLD